MGIFEIKEMGKQQTGWVCNVSKTSGYVCSVNIWKFRSEAYKVLELGIFIQISSGCRCKLKLEQWAKSSERVSNKKKEDIIKKIYILKAVRVVSRI